MELTFQKNTIAYLQKLVSQVNTREETAELTIPEQEPDIGRVVGAWATAVVRSPELQPGTMTVSGGINGWVLYVPSDGGSPRTMEAYLPFSMKWDLPQKELQGDGRISCRVQSVDARMVGTRRILLRATVSCLGEVYGESEAEFYTLPDPPETTEVLKQTLPLLLPGELCHKSFRLEEMLTLPVGTPEVGRVVSWQFQPTITDGKVLGEKAVFKGICQFHLLYMTPEGRLSVWDTEVPFSQYGELTRHYEQEEELQCIPVINNMSLTKDEGGELVLQCDITVQCVVMSRHKLELVADLYALNRQTTLQSAALPVRTRLDHQSLRQVAEIPFPLHGATILECTVLPGSVRVVRQGDVATIELPVWGSLVYYDETGALQGRQCRSSTTRELNLASGCQCLAQGMVCGPVQWTVDGGGITVRAPVELATDCYADQELAMLRGAVLGEEVRPSDERPSVIVKTLSGDQTLWTLAKENHSTVDAIRKANRLQSAPPEAGKLLLIPVL